MRAFVTVPWAIGMVMLAGAAAFGDEPDQAAQPSLVGGSLPEFAHRAFQITDVVLDHHVEPPTRQEMLLCGLTALLGEAAPEDLSRAVSGVASEGDFVECLVRCWPEKGLSPRFPRRNEFSDDARRWRFLTGLSNAVPGGLDFMLAKEAAVQRQLAANQYVGIGVALANPGNGNLYQFAEVLPRGTAAKAGIEHGELLLAVDGATTEKLSTQELIDRLRGPEGTTVTVKVARDAKSEPRELTLTRSVVPRQTVIGNRKLGPEQWEIVVPGERPVGYLMIQEIGGSTVSELREYEAELAAKQVNELVLDLRFADSRELRYAIALADALIDGGNAGWVRWRDGRRPVQLDRDCLFRDWRLAVLVAERTDGYGEWIAAALQKMRGASAVGLTTQGDRRFVLTAVELPDGRGVVRLATNVLEGSIRPGLAPRPDSLLFRLLEIRRVSNQHEAVIPDVFVPLVPGENEFGPGRQSLLVARAVEALANPPQRQSEGFKDEAARAP